jgi:hypothetical protein
MSRQAGSMVRGLQSRAGNPPLAGRQRVPGIYCGRGQRSRQAGQPGPSVRAVSPIRLRAWPAAQLSVGVEACSIARAPDVGIVTRPARLSPDGALVPKSGSTPAVDDAAAVDRGVATGAASVCSTGRADGHKGYREKNCYQNPHICSFHATGFPCRYPWASFRDRCRCKPVSGSIAKKGAESIRRFGSKRNRKLANNASANGVALRALHL